MRFCEVKSLIARVFMYVFELLRAIEAGVSAYPKMEGRFPQSSGLTVKK